MNEHAATTDHRTFTVAGMSCGHCVISVEEEVSDVSGVESVEVELDTGRLEVRGAGFSDDAVRAAVAEAGYEVVS